MSYPYKVGDLVRVIVYNPYDWPESMRGKSLVGKVYKVVELTELGFGTTGLRIALGEGRPPWNIVPEIVEPVSMFQGLSYTYSLGRKS